MQLEGATDRGTGEAQDKTATRGEGEIANPPQIALLHAPSDRRGGGRTGRRGPGDEIQSRTRKGTGASQ